MPSLRVLGSVVKHDIQQQSKAFSSAAVSKYHLVVPNIADSKNDALKYQTFTRNVHETKKKDQSPLLSKKSEFALMSLNTLKTECRKRGLKVSGRKADLVSRIATYDSSYSTKAANSISTQIRAKKPQATPVVQATQQTMKRFSQSTKADAKGDVSHIDYIKPVDLSPSKLVEDDYIVQIPSLSTDASNNAVTELEKQLSQASNPNETIVSKAPGSDTKIFEQGSVDSVDTQNVEALEVEVADILGQEAEEYKDEPYEYDYSDVSGNDKKFLAGFLAAAGLWWFLPTGTKSKQSKEEKEEKH